VQDVAQRDAGHGFRQEENVTRERRRLALASTATAASVLLAGAGGIALAGPAAQTRIARTVDTPAASPGFSPVQASPALPAVPAEDIPWTIADPAFDYNATTGRPGAAFTPLLDADGQPRTRVLTGIHRGASYRIEVPLRGWNGDVVFWEHGFRGTGTTLYVDSPGYGLRQTYIDAGYAWAASSYSANRYDIHAAMVSTERLARHFDRLVKPADDRYLQGVSMGGHIIGGLLERQRVRWDGAAPMCGVMGDLAQFDIPLSYNLVAQAFAEVDAFPFSTPEEYQAVVPRIKEALGLSRRARQARTRRSPTAVRSCATSSSTSPADRAPGPRTPSPSGRGRPSRSAASRATRQGRSAPSLRAGSRPMPTSSTRRRSPSRTARRSTRRSSAWPPLPRPGGTALGPRSRS
jgi:hypothetical protein